jgi:hypothetical protein
VPVRVDEIPIDHDPRCSLEAEDFLLRANEIAVGGPWNALKTNSKHYSSKMRSGENLVMVTNFDHDAKGQCRAASTSTS